MAQTTITKSVRLSPVESAELLRLSEQSGMSEASLMKKWVLAGIHAQNVDLAIQAYMARKTDLRGGAALAGVSYHEFLHEVQTRNIVVLEDDQFLEELDFLATAFDDATLREAMQKVRAADEFPTATV